ncbi:MAG TPA: cytochrome ubiquinol oxidase subunit I [Polyangia bacterium]
MDSALAVHRLHFAFTVTFHYLFPQLTMGLAPLIVACKVLARATRNETYNEAARLLGRVFAVSFIFGVVTGIPMEFQFGTNWARFSRFAGGIIGQTLAMEGMFAFFLESSFLGLFLFGEKRLSPRAHMTAAVAVFLGSWLSGYFIVATDAWMQHPVGYTRLADGSVHLDSLWALVFNPWAFWQFVHTMGGAAVTGAFATAALGAYYKLRGRHDAVAGVLVKVGVVAAVLAATWQAFPSGDGQGQQIAESQPATLAAMEGLFKTPPAGAPMLLVGQPNVAEGRIDNAIEIPRMLSFLTHKRWDAEVKGLDAFAPDTWPDNIALLYFSYHVMVGLGTILIAIAGLAFLLLLSRRLLTNRPVLWALLLAAPLPYIANTAGWMTAEIGRQPWLVYGLMRTAAGTSHRVSEGNALFSLLGFMGLYSLLLIVFVLLTAQVIARGPATSDAGIGVAAQPDAP